MRNMEFEYISLFLETFILFLDPFRDVLFLIVCISFFALEPNTPSICTNICHLSDPNPILKESVQMSHKGACTYYVINFCPIPPPPPLRNQDNHCPYVICVLRP